MGWLNSDDMLHPGALHTVAEVFASLRPRVAWITGVPTSWDETGRLTRVGRPRCCPRRWIRAGLYHGDRLGWLQQESMFWTRGVWEKAGGALREDCGLAADFELWTRLARYAHLVPLDIPLAGFRHRAGQRSSVRERYVADADRVAAQLPGRALRATAACRPCRRAMRFLARRVVPCAVKNPRTQVWELAS
jgi:hypothetical protein